MTPSIAEARPPYVTFEVRAVEDRAATIATGHYVAKDVHFVCITPQGSRDRIERIASEWFEHLESQVREGRLPDSWLSHFRAAYKAFCDGCEAPVSGTAVTNWTSASPAQIKQLISAGVRTVEDLAAANEESLRRIGMGGRALKQRAVDWLTAAAGTGKLVEEMTVLRAANFDLTEQNAALASRVDELARQVAAMSRPAKAA